MTPEQLKLIKVLTEIGDVTLIKRDVQSVVKAISFMDIPALELILEDDISYYDTTKTIFLQKLNDVFVEFHKEDTRLFPYIGKCNSDECSNTNKKGVAFIGNISGRYLNLILEQNEEGFVKDIYTCSSFCTNEKIIDENKIELRITVYKDEKIDFKPTPNYQFNNNNSIKAIFELKQFNEAEITKAQIISWIKEYENLYKSMDWLNHFYKDQKIFYDCFYEIRTIYRFLIIDDEAFIALSKLKQLISKMNLNYKNG